VKAKNSPYNEFSLYANQNPYDRIYDENGEFVEKLSSGDWNKAGTDIVIESQVNPQPVPSGFLHDSFIRIIS